MSALVYLVLISVACGYINAENNEDDFVHAPRIFNGSDASIGMFPFHAQITQGVFPRGAGVIINRRWILTCAHLLTSPKFIFGKAHVLVGSSKLGKGTKCKVDKYIPHPEYGKGGSRYANDIALMRLAEPLKMSTAVRQINLPVDQSMDYSYDAWIMGFGATERKGSSKVLKAAKIHVLAPGHEACQRCGIVDGVVLFINKIMLCAGDMTHHRDSGWGDSGGPLMVQNNGMFYVIGIVAWGYDFKDHRGRCPSYYTRVSSYLPWIHQTMKNNSRQG